ncbi:hypothetical protein JQ760_027815 (plasmid) [Klebsiella pneumoniae]|uniref:DUF7673 family protein n=1 Tax=Klebsiella pneumoniae TaxID=573 RepID=UPI001FAC3AAB|nr:hypothetical protein [Klebsiella pneumoniae]MCI8109171.1 hypothetical protein [Klebsiella pneumoniae]
MMDSESFRETMLALDERAAQRAQVVSDGTAALKRLVEVAQGDSGQSQVIASFLLSLYNSYRFRFNLVELRSLDFCLFDDCISVLKMDYQPEVDVHERIENGSAIWESLATQWKNNETENDR